MAAERPRVGARARPALAADVGRLLADAHSRTAIPTGALEARLDENLTIGVVGRTNAGKSTLVNTLIGHRIAPTSATECTRVITVYRFGAQETAEVVLTDGTTRTLRLTRDGRLPDEPGAPLDRVQRIDVWRSYEPLRRVNVIDTPGLFGDAGLAAQTEQLLNGDGVDAVLFVYRGAVSEYEVEVLRRFRRRTRHVYDAPVNVLGVLTHADLLGDPDDAWDIASATARRHAHELSDYLSGVVPVIGKIAETTETGRFGQDHADWLRQLATLPPDVLDDGLTDADEFAELDCPVPPNGRGQLVERLDLYGIRAIATSSTARDSAPQIADTLRSISGIAGLRDRIGAMFVRPASVHKAAHVLTGLQRVADGAEIPAAERDWLKNAIGEIRSAAAMHVLDELRALAALHCGRCDLPEVDREAAIRMFIRTEPAERLGIPSGADATLADAARHAETRWSIIEKSTMDPQAAMVAGTAAWSAALLAQACGAR